MGEQRRHYTAEDKMRAAEAYVRRGGAKSASIETNIPRETIRDWVAKDEVFEEWRVRTLDEHQGELLAYHASLCWKTADEMADRIENGDPIVHQGQVTGYAKPPLNVMMKAHGIIFDKMRIGLALPTSYSSQSSNVQQQLQKLQDALEGALEGRTERHSPPTKQPRNGQAEQINEPVH